MNAPSSWPRRGLYLLTPDDPDTDRFLARVRPVLADGPVLLQYRNKAAAPADRRRQVEALLPACRALGLPLLVNDDWRLAAETGADGAHLGQDDGSLAEARRALGPTALLGASCYDQLALAERAAAAGASYVAFGAFFASGTKPLARRADLQLLADSAVLGLPRVAIGGITPDNAPTLVAAGADLLAVIGGVFEARDPAAAVRAYRRAFDPPSQRVNP
ncbi:thiamine phosphate synthase [Arenimonas sp.]|uniref:thiamine phosphate synthase n=1 Tax=Arenimonas sp. TaxID=1872635 RepID=UPI002E327E31|nr:thiamine phosphate synthase [Arenimonas sp.]HEX4853145.1 thiamine phosphate synthase [Arenimonas sp.]